MIMKPTSQFARSFVRNIAFTALCLGFATVGFAAKKPLSYPKGLAVDAKGNLYVANSGGNDILVYNTNYAQVAKDTITSNIINPSAVAIDAQGNLWVANYGTSNGGSNGSVAEYTAGKQNTSASITSGILGPEALAVDGAGNIWVENDYTNITVYAPTSVYAPSTTPVRTFNPTFPIYGLTVGDNTVSWGSNAGTYFAPATAGLVSGSLETGYSFGNDNGVALATDASGNVYMGNSSGVVNISFPAGYEAGPFAQLSFSPGGIAIDNMHGRIYFSNTNGNSISVYSTATSELLKVIQ
jgi:NHL repeat